MIEHGYIALKHVIMPPQLAIIQVLPYYWYCVPLCGAIPPRTRTLRCAAPKADLARHGTNARAPAPLLRGRVCAARGVRGAKPNRT